MKFIEKTKIWFTISLILIIIGMGTVVFRGLNYGIDFTGGTIIDIALNDKFEKSKADEILDKYAKNKYATKVVDNGKELEIIVQDGVLTDETTDNLIEDMKKEFSLDDSAILGKENLGGTIGRELKVKAFIAAIVANIAMLIYIGFRFEFNFAAAAIIAVLHDVLITVGVYAVLGIPVNTPFIAAVLTIIGYSINDTIVIFDRIRENSKKMRKVEISEIANISINQTLSRSINTALTTLFTITAVYVFVPSIREFSLPLIIGIAMGAYSSIFIASPIWVILKNRKKAAKI
ncbi:protein translocase subunit SecF [Clostridium senegalense]|uniref:Protein-export membrane protein SecF n=1 Tax=Clostridium senegalense TaxID=1465809 RepID=A0A6M0GZC9_9CLOT|nr:protein translocase subunit SecF [Clostridium senegalense]NEU03880.1 protein translocase subunit SecF [Clostridium senegalense]